MIAKKSKKRLFGLVSTALAASILMQWLIIPKIQWNSKVYAEVERTYPQNYDSTSSVNYATILGGAVDYGIVAGTLNQNQHMETTYATNVFNNTYGNNDPDYIQSTAHFIIGSLGSGSTNTPPIVFGYTTASALYVEAPSAVFGSGFNSANCLHDQTTGNFGFGNLYTDRPFIQAVNENASSNVNRLINRMYETNASNEEVDGRSLAIHNRAAGSDAANYVLNPNGDNCPFFYDQNFQSFNSSSNASKLLIDLTDPQFENRVVYINVTSRMLEFMDNTDETHIYKHDSTIVVFNIEDSVCPDSMTLAGPALYIDQPFDSTGVKTYENGHTGINGTDTNPTTKQRQYNETLVYNVRTDGSVTLSTAGGVMLFPLASSVTVKNGNSTGWIVASNTVNVDDEFHFLYNGTSTDGPGQMHFALLKGFTTAYADKPSVVPVTSVGINSGDYSFTIQEYSTMTSFGGESNSLLSGGLNNANNPVSPLSNVVFPSLQFSTGTEANPDEHYYIQTPSATASGDSYNSRDYYFRITENASAVSGVETSGGYIDIDLQVRVDESGHFTYWVKYISTTGSNGTTTYEDRRSNSGINTSDGYIAMSGVQFDLGTFYNKANRSLTITKTITGDYVVPAGGKTYQFYVYTGDGDNKTYYNADGTSNGSTPVAIEITVPKGLTTASISIPNLLDGTYHVDEIAASAAVTGYDLDSGTHTTTATLSAASPIAQANITNDYTKQHNLEVTKILSGSGAGSIDPDAEFEFTIYDGTQYVQADGTLGPKPVTFSVKVGDTFKINVPAGNYQIIEDTTKAASYATGSIVFDADASGTTVNVSPSSPSSPAIGVLENVYNDSSIGTLTISKSVKGATFDSWETVGVSVSYVDETDHTTYYIQYDSNTGVSTPVSSWTPTIFLKTDGTPINITGSFVTAGRIFTVTELNPGNHRADTYNGATISLNGSAFQQPPPEMLLRQL